MRYTRPGLRAISRAVLYTRVSLDRKGKARSVEEQETEGRTACEEEGWQVTEVFCDNDRSASRFARKERPRYAELLNFLRSGGADVLVLWEPSRGDRELERWVQLIKLCRQHGVLIHVVSHEQTYDLSRPKDFKALASEGVDSAYESDKTSQRVGRAMRGAAMDGRPHGKLLYGYRREYDLTTGELVGQVVDEQQADVIREAARRFVAGKACYEIAQDFNARGVQTPRYWSLMRKAVTLRGRAQSADEGKRVLLLAEAQAAETQAAQLRWDLTQIKRLVINPAYAALRVHRGGVVGKADWPAILDGETYDACRSRAGDPRRKTMRDGTVKHLLSGTARCGMCGAPMRVQKNRSVLSYMCRGSFCSAVKVSWLEEFVTSVIVARLQRPDALAAFEVAPADADAAAEEADRLRARLDGFYAEAARGKISPRGMTAIEEELLPQVTAAQARADAVTGVPPLLRGVAGPDAAARWDALAIGQRRQVVSLLCDIRVGKTRQGARSFDFWRLSASRWHGDDRTWGEHWSADLLEPSS